MSRPEPESGVFRQTFPLHYPDADASGHLRLTALLNFLQIQAEDHTTTRGFEYRPNKDAGIFWVLSRLSLRIDDWPQWPYRLTLDTWARATKAVYALRDFRFGTDVGPWSGRASTAWVLLKDRKAQRPEPYVAIYDQVRPEPPVAEIPEALPAFDALPSAADRAEPLVRQTHSVRAGWEDLDMNGHVNNVNAVGWCLAQHDSEFLHRWRPAQLEVNFLAEMLSGQTFMIHRDETKSSAESRTFEYLVDRREDNTPTVRMRITYR